MSVIISAANNWGIPHGICYAVVPSGPDPPWLTGIPTSIGIAPTKTLAKIAGKIAKKAPHGVFDLTDPGLREKVPAKTDVIDIWGTTIERQRNFTLWTFTRPRTSEIWTCERHYRRQ